MDLGRAMKNLDDTINEKIYKNMSERAAKLLKEDMDGMDSLSDQDIGDAQKKILGLFQGLVDDGKINLS